MLDVMRAVRALLDVSPSTVRTHIGDASGKSPPFRVLWGPPSGRDQDEPVASIGSWSARLGLTCTAATAEAALQLAHDAVHRLTPRHDPAVIPGVPGRHVQIVFREARDVQIDRTTTYDGTGHPAFVVLLFTVHSQPI